MGAIGEEALEQQALLGQLIEVRGDIARTTQRTHRVTGEAFHQDYDDVLDRQGFFRRRRGVATHRSGIRINQLVIFSQQHVAHGLRRYGLLKGSLPDIGAIVTEAAFRSGNQ